MFAALGSPAGQLNSCEGRFSSMGMSSISSAAAASSSGTTYSYSTIISAFTAGFFLGYFMGFAYLRSLYLAYAMGQRSTARAGSPAGKLI